VLATAGAAVLAALLVVPAHAQPTPTPQATATLGASPVIDGVNINADAGLAPGSTLDITLRGTPRGQAAVLLPGGGGLLRLREREPGLYVGSYTVGQADRIDPQAPIRATVAQGPRSTIASFRFPPSFRDPETATAVKPAVPLESGAAHGPDAAQSTAIMGAAAPAAVVPLVLQVTPPASTVVDARAGVVLEGRTAPNALVRTRVDAVPPAAPGRASVAQLVMEETVQADAEGRFRVRVGPQRAAPGTHFEIGLRASQGEQSTPEQRLVLVMGDGQG
jgi:hypothetical protein